MKATTLITIQFISFICIIGSTEGLFKEAFASIIFFLAFASFAITSIYISRNDKRIIRDTNRYFAKKG